MFLLGPHSGAPALTCHLCYPLGKDVVLYLPLELFSEDGGGTRLEEEMSRLKNLCWKCFQGEDKLAFSLASFSSP